MISMIGGINSIAPMLKKSESGKSDLLMICRV